MEDIIEVGLLMDFYGQLLTKRQYEFMDLYYNHDLSLSEISEQVHISRQGVHDGIKKAKTILIKMEEKLGLLHKFKVQRDRATKASDILKEIRAYSRNESLIDMLNALQMHLEAISNLEQDEIMR